MVVQKVAGSLTVAGDTPTVAEITTGLAASGDDKCIVLGPYAGGQWGEPQVTTVNGDDTVRGLTEQVFSINQVTGKFSELTETEREELATVNTNNRVKAWIIDDAGYVWGEASGYEGALNIDPKSKTRDNFMSMPFSFEWLDNLDSTDKAAQDSGFLSLTNP